MRPMQRIWIQCGEKKKKIVLTDPPWTDVGEILTFGTEEWVVLKTEMDEGVTIPTGAK